MRKNIYTVHCMPCNVRLFRDRCKLREPVVKVSSGVFDENANYGAYRCKARFW